MRTGRCRTVTFPGTLPAYRSLMRVENQVASYAPASPGAHRFGLASRPALLVSLGSLVLVLTAAEWPLAGLYDIDRIISRTLAYAVVTGILIGLYAGLVLLATRVLSFHTPVAVAASTLAAAALFNPLRRRV